MIKILTLIASLLLAVPATAQDRGQESAAQFAGWCKAVGSVVEQRDHSFQFPQDQNSMACWGAFAAIQQLSRIVGADKKPLLNICAPPESGRLQFIRVFTQFVAVNPAIEYKDFGLIILQSLQAAFPCPK